MSRQFSIKVAIEMLQIINKQNPKEDIPFRELSLFLDEFTLAFKELNTFLGMAFNDVKQKVAVFEQNLKRFPEVNRGFLQFVVHQMSLNIHQYNRSNNSSLKAPKEFKEYNSTARNLLRMMWLLSFIRSTFEQCRDHPQKTLREVFSQAYDVAFGQKHNWALRHSAKAAIYASSDKKRLLQVISQSQDPSYFETLNQKFLSVLIPVHDSLWGFYRQHNLVDLE